MLTKILQKLKPHLVILIPFLMAFRADTNKSEYNLFTAARSVCSADFDNDGDFDLVVGHSYDFQTEWGGLTFLNNHSSGNFEFSDTLFHLGGYTTMYCEYLTNNIYPDIVFLSSNGTDLFLTVLSKEKGNYQASYYQTGIGVNHFILNDINGDQKLDALFISNWDRYWGILYNQGNGIFSEPEYYDIEGYPPTDITCGDLDGDGRNDVVVSGSKLMVHYNTENGFISQQLGTQLTDVKISDFDSDGDNDIVIFNDVAIVGYTEIVFFENIDNTGFQEHEEVLFSPSSSRFLIQDINRDQKPDLVFLSSFPFLGEPGVVDTTGGIYIVYNQGNFELSGPQFVPVKNYSEHWRNFHCADFDNNGFPDFAIVKTLYVELPSNLEILFNDGNGNFGQEPIVSLPNQPQRQSSRLSCFPNPFHCNITITIQQQNNIPSEVHIYNLHGQLIKQFTYVETQNSEITWSGTNQEGVPQPEGIYLVVLMENQRVCETKRIVRTK